MNPTRPVLRVRGLRAFHGATPVVQGVDLDLRGGEIVALLGRNGAGRSSLAAALMGLVRAQGFIGWEGRNLVGLAPHVIARLGLGYVPEGRDVFPTLTVHQNLQLGCKPGLPHPRASSPESLDAMVQRFPALLARMNTPAGVLSGGEQQMLSLCRTLMGQPRLLVVDEPTEGLAPGVAMQVARCLADLRERGVGVLWIEQKLDLALELADRVLVMGRGRIVFEGTADQLQAQPGVRQEWLEV